MDEMKIIEVELLLRGLDYDQTTQLRKRFSAQEFSLIIEKLNKTDFSSLTDDDVVNMIEGKIRNFLR